MASLDQRYEAARYEGAQILGATWHAGEWRVNVGTVGGALICVGIGPSLGCALGHALGLWEAMS